MILCLGGDKPGSDCPSTKDSNNLCDCGSKICVYEKGEALDPNTCKCVGGVGKRDADDITIDELENTDDHFVALPKGMEMEPMSEEKRDIRKIPMSNAQAKREFRKLSFNMDKNEEK